MRRVLSNDVNYENIIIEVTNTSQHALNNAGNKIIRYQFEVALYDFHYALVTKRDPMKSGSRFSWLSQETSSL